MNDGAWYHPPTPLPADTRGKRLADRLTLRTVLPTKAYAIVMSLGVIGAFVGSALPMRPGLAVLGVTGLVVGAFCTLNFWRCRHAHCLVTGPGYLAFSAIGLAGAALGHSLIGGFEGIAFLGLFLAAVAFEALLHAVSGSRVVELRSKG